MSRTITESPDDSLRELPTQRSKPDWLQADHALPFSKLSGDEFEVLCFLLLRKQFPSDRVYYYGKTADMGRDIIHVSTGGRTRLIQCKNFATNVSISEVASEMAKVYVNVFSKAIPEQPDEVVFFVSRDLTATSQDLIQYQSEWTRHAKDYLSKFLKQAPSDDLLLFANEWWPFGDRQGGLAITQDIFTHDPTLLDSFFGVRKVVDATRADVRNDIRDELEIALEPIRSVLQSSDRQTAEIPSTTLPIHDIRKKIASASQTLLSWPRTLGEQIWIERPEVEILLNDIQSKPTLVSVLLGEPGSGKSALLAQLGISLRESGVACLAIKADTLDVHVDTLGKLAERLDFSGTVADCVKTLAATEKVVVLIDQLDAVADLVDLRSDRLNVLLNLIHELAETPNVYVIASSRTFEFAHDARFRTINAEEVVLSLPSWETIAAILQKRGTQAENWPANFREVLRAPQNLKLFVEQLTDSSEQRVFDSYQQMLEELWYRKVTRSADADAKSILLATISEEMSNREVLWLPLAQFDARRATLNQLVADGILKISDNRFQFGFQHQTLLSHARARAIVQGQTDFAEYVIQRQHALFIRPTLWSTLGYLREASKDAYRKQMTRLCSESLRLHVQHLLLDFIGRLQDPDGEEEAWLKNWLENDDFRRRALLAISNSKGWFDRLRDSHIADVMQTPQGAEWQIVQLLSIAANHSPGSVLDLIEEYWLQDPDMDRLTFRIFDEFAHWNERAISIICKIVARSTINESFVTSIASKAAAYTPKLAPRIVAVEFRRQLNAVRTAAASQSDTVPDNADLAERLSAEFTRRLNNPICKLLDSADGRYDMPAIAEAAPMEFLNEMWPALTEAIDLTLDGVHHIINRYRSSHVHYDFDSNSDVRHPLMGAVLVAMLELGQHDFPAFERFFRKAMVSDSMLVQRLVCRTLVELAPESASLSFEYLTSDSRRLMVGDYQEPHSETRALIAKISPELGESRLRDLEKCIANWTEYQPNIPDEDVETRRDRRQWDREARLWLQLSIPSELLSSESKASLTAEETALPTVKKRMEEATSETEFGKVLSPMSTEQMNLAQDAQVLKLFDELPDGADWHPRHSGVGGTVEASTALAELAKSSPERAAKILKQLRSTDHQVPASFVIRSIGDTAFPSIDYFSLIHELVGLGFNSQDFQDSVASSCTRRAGQADGLPADICNLLKSWLRLWVFRTDESGDIGESDEERTRSVVFDGGGTYTLPRGTYWILCALSYGLIRRDPPASEEWLEVLQSHVGRAESARVWKVFCHELRMLRYCNSSAAMGFLEELFAKYPSVRDSRFGARLLAGIRKLLGEKVYVRYCEELGKSDWSFAQQAKGELFGVSYIMQDGFESVDQTIEEAMKPASIMDGLLLKGIAFAAARLWANPRCRSRATSVFESIARRGSDVANSALSELFLNTAFVPTKDSKRILQVTAENPSLIRDVSAYHFAEMLELFAASMPDAVLKLASALLDQLEAQREDEHRRDFDLADSALTSIAITLQRDERRRAAGLDLFERLLKWGFTETVQTVRELDNRPVGVVHRARRQRRKK